MKKRLIRLVLLVAALLCLTVFASAAETIASGTCGENLTWTLTDDGALTIEGTGDMDIYGRGDAPWYTKRGSIQAVTFGNSVTSISHFAFYDCYNLTEATIGESVDGIGNTAFTSCKKLVAITVSDANSAYSSTDGVLFDKAKTKLIIYPTGNERTSYVIPASTAEIITGAFSNCSSLTEVRFLGNAPDIGANTFLNVTATCYYPANDTTWTSDVLQNYGGTLTWKGLIDAGTCGENLTWNLSDDGVLTIEGTGAMYNYSTGTAPWYEQRDVIHTVCISNDATTIGKHAFLDCGNVTDVSIGSSVTAIQWGAFGNCTSLPSLTIPDSVTTIEQYVFGGCSSLEAITVSDQNTAYSSIDGVLFNKDQTILRQYPIGNSRTVYAIPKSVNTIGLAAFSGCSNLTKVTIPDSVTLVSMSAFDGCTGLSELTIPVSVTTIDTGAFWGCSNLSSVTIPDSVTTIGSHVFYDCLSLTKVSLPDSITKIGEYSFYNCSSLTKVTIPISVTTIGDWAFSKCTALENVTFQGNAPTVEGNTFTFVTATCYYPANDSTWTSDVMQNYGGTLTWKPYSLSDFYGASMTLGNDLRMNFYISVKNLPETGLLASITRNGAVTTIPMTQWETSGSYYKITYAGIAAKEMAESISVVILDADGEPVSSEWVDGVRSYAMRIIDRESTPLKQKILLVDMLNYGAAAQENFNYNTDVLANAQLTEEHKALATGSVSLSDYRVKGTNYYGSALILSSNIQLKLYFSNVTPDMTAKVSYTNHMGVQKTVEKEIHMSGSYGYVLVEELVVADGRQLVSCTVTDTDGNVAAYVTDSLESYCFRTMESQPLNDYLMRFVESAYSLFH